MSDRNTQLFLSLVIGLVQAAYTQLGKVKNELTGTIDRNLDAARITIDTLAVLELKTKGNLSDEEAEVLKRALTELRMNYVDELQKQAAQPPAEVSSSLNAEDSPGGP